jgi:hypothetical protein
VIAAYGDAPGEVHDPSALAADADGNLYVAEPAEYDNRGLLVQDRTDRIQKRDARGNWSIVAAAGDAPGQVDSPGALAADAAGNLYVADFDSYGDSRIQKRDTQGHWSILDTDHGGFLAADSAGNLLVSPVSFKLPFVIQERDSQGNWTEDDTGPSSGLSGRSTAIAVDAAGNLYVAVAVGGKKTADFDSTFGDDQIGQRDAQGHWSVIATSGLGLGQVSGPRGLAVDTAGNLYVADSGRIQKRDVQGHWSLVASEGSALGQVGDYVDGLAVDGAGNLYVSDNLAPIDGKSRVLKYTPGP